MNESVNEKVIIPEFDSMTSFKLKKGNIKIEDLEEALSNQIQKRSLSKAFNSDEGPDASEHN